MLMPCQGACSDVVGAVPPGPLWDTDIFSTHNSRVSTFVQADSLRKGVRLVNQINESFTGTWIFVKFNKAGFQQVSKYIASFCYRKGRIKQYSWDPGFNITVGRQLSCIRDDTVAAFQLSVLFIMTLHKFRCLLKWDTL